MKLIISKVQREEINLNKSEMKEVTQEYLRDILGGVGCYVTKEGNLEHWTSYPHGSGTTTNCGKATDLQIAAYRLLEELRNHVQD